MCGYQGWFGAEGDGIGRGWYHWAGPDGFKPGSCKIDLWPDVSELDPDERYATPFKHADGRPAEVFSSFNRKTVGRHFRWMRDYGLDGSSCSALRWRCSTRWACGSSTVVLQNCREGAQPSWTHLRRDVRPLRHGRRPDEPGDGGLEAAGRPHANHPRPGLPASPGQAGSGRLGLRVQRRTENTLQEGLELVRFLKEDPRYGGCTVMLGVPTYWRTLERDCVNDPTMHELIRRADIVSPWTVGRYRNPQQATEYAQRTLVADLRWCRENKLEYLPVVFPGFSWHNMSPTRH